MNEPETIPSIPKIPSILSIPKISKISKIPKKNKLLTVRINEEDLKMINELKSRPHSINISDFVRASIKNLYEVRIIRIIRISKEGHKEKEN